MFIFKVNKFGQFLLTEIHYRRPSRKCHPRWHTKHTSLNYLTWILLNIESLSITFSLVSWLGREEVVVVPKWGIFLPRKCTRGFIVTAASFSTIRFYNAIVLKPLLLLVFFGRLCSSFSKLSFVFLSKEILHHFPVSFKPFSLSDVVKNKESGLGLVVRFLKVGGERLYKQVELGHPPIWCVPV